jgi:hypothetical protein
MIRKADTDAAITAFGKSEQVKKVFWALARRAALPGGIRG